MNNLGSTKIPDEKWKELYAIEDFQQWTIRYKELIQEYHPEVIIDGESIAGVFNGIYKVLQEQCTIGVK